jgi:hypothetical protein
MKNSNKENSMTMEINLNLKLLINKKKVFLWKES